MQHLTGCVVHGPGRREAAASARLLPGKEQWMILESAHLEVKAGQEEAFEAAFGQAKQIIASMPGFISLELQRCIEIRRRYLLLVRWRTLQDHTVGFRASAQYQEWKTLLHHFYDPFPTVEHYERRFSA
jgi:heme-degrading monooxygenase HmoA